MDINWHSPETKAYAVAIVVVGAYALYVRSKRAATTTTTTPAAGTGATTGTDTSGITSAIQSAFGTLGAGETAIAKQLTSQQASIDQTHQDLLAVGQGDAGALTALAKAESAAFANTNTGITGLGTSLTSAITGQGNTLASDIAGIGTTFGTGLSALQADVNAGLGNATSALNQSITAGNSGLASGIAGLSTQQTGLFAALTKFITDQGATVSKAFADQAARLDSMTAGLATLNTDQGTTQGTADHVLGAESAASCFGGGGNFSWDCATVKYGVDGINMTGHGKDTAGMAYLQAQLQQKYAPCWNASTGTMDQACVGKHLRGGT